MDITTLRGGRYWLVHRADPGLRLLETDETNNASSLLLDIRRAPQDPSGVTVQVVRSCPGAAYCDVRG